MLFLRHSLEISGNQLIQLPETSLLHAFGFMGMFLKFMNIKRTNLFNF